MKKFTVEPKVLANERITGSEVRLIGQENNQVGLINKSQALQMAKDVGLDLVQISQQDKVSVCRIVDLGKFLYENKRKEQRAKKNQKISHIKAINFRVNIESGDYSRKKANIIKFLEQGNHVKVMVRFFGRENIYPQAGINIIKQLIQDLEELSSYKGDLKKQGNSITVIFMPK